MKNTKLQNPSLRKRKGFTLIELIVVIAILAILAAIAIPAFVGTLNRSKIRSHNANVRVIQSAVAVYAAETGVEASTFTSADLADLIPEYLDANPDDPRTSGDTDGGEYSVTNGVVSPIIDPDETDIDIDIDAPAA